MKPEAELKHACGVAAFAMDDVQTKAEAFIATLVKAASAYCTVLEKETDPDVRERVKEDCWKFANLATDVSKAVPDSEEASDTAEQVYDLACRASDIVQPTTQGRSLQ